MGRRAHPLLSTAVLGTALALATAGCSGAGEKPGLTVWIMEGTHPDASGYFADVNAEFEKRTGVEATVEFIPWADAHGKFVTAVAGGTTPDVAEVGTTWTPEFGAAGAFTDLTARVGDTSAYVPGLVEAGTVDGRLYGVPWHAAIRAVLYRTDVFAELGLEPPRDWAGLRATAMTVAEEREDLVAFPVPGGSEYSLLPFIWGAGGEVAVPNGDGTWTAGVGGPEAREGISFYTDLARRDGVSSTGAATWLETDVQDSFADERVAMAVAGNWTPKAILAANPGLEGRIGAFPIPGRHGGHSPSFLGGSHLSVFNGAKDPDLAWSYIELLTEDGNAARWARETTYFPGKRAQLAAFTESDDPLVRPFAVQMSRAARSVPVDPAYGRVQGRQVLTRMTQSILSGEADVGGAAAAAAREIEQALNEAS